MEIQATETLATKTTTWPAVIQEYFWFFILKVAKISLTQQSAAKLLAWRKYLLPKWVFGSILCLTQLRVAQMVVAQMNV